MPLATWDHAWVIMTGMNLCRDICCKLSELFECDLHMRYNWGK